MSDIVDSLLLLARADAGTLDPADQIVDLTSLVRSVTAARGADADARRLTLQADGPTPAPVRGDARLLAIRSTTWSPTRFATATVPARWVVRAATTADTATLMVQDQGIGIAADRLPHLFERFFRADADRSHRAGLGLAIVHAIAERHGAACHVDSEVGRGTRVEVVFPRAQA